MCICFLKRINKGTQSYSAPVKSGGQSNSCRKLIGIIPVPVGIPLLHDFEGLFIIDLHSREKKGRIVLKKRRGDYMQGEFTFYKRSLVITFILLVLLILWGIIAPISIAEIEQYQSRIEFVQFLTSASLIYHLNYLIATLLTFFIVAFFTILFLESKADFPLLSHIGFIFVPVYAVINIIIYSSQISIVPDIARYINLQGNALLDHWVFQMIQSTYGTIFSKINAFAYAILGIPSICFGLTLCKKSRMGKIASFFLIINAVLCILGFVGLGIGNKLLSSGVMIGGFIFIVATLFVFLHYMRMIKGK